jgi:hypothetical protein
MKVTFSNFFKISIVLIVLLSAVSCDKKSDLLVEYVLSDNLQNEKLDGFAVDNSSKTDTDQRAVQDALANDIYAD